MRTQNTGGCTMDKVLVGVVSEAEFSRAQERIPELSNYVSYDDWMDSRYGRFMGLSLGGAETSMETLGLDDFLSWCRGRRISPNENALDAYARHALPRSHSEPLSAA
jgi:hypothetical protein